MRRFVVLSFAALLGLLALPVTAFADCTQEVCNGVDDDCDTKTDAADSSLLKTPCEKQLGVCAGSLHSANKCVGGVWTACSTTNYTSNNPAYLGVEPSTNCDTLDNDCDGYTDETYANVAITCGVGACQRSGYRKCGPTGLYDDCTPGTAGTEVFNHVDDDCDGSTDEGVTCPGLPSDTTCDNVDDDCDNAVDEDYPATPSGTFCGVGACVREGTTVCVAGALTVTCTPGAPGTEECNGIDDDCDGKTDAADSSMVKTPCELQEGVCAGSLHSANKCVGGAWTACTTTNYTLHDALYLAVEPTTNCDGFDNDCDGGIDEVYAPYDTTCGEGACASTGQMVCTLGALDDTCEAGTAGTEVYNFVDDDCDGSTDEGTTCEPIDTDDTTCDGVDDDCSGDRDEDFVPYASSSTCGVGACLANGEYQCVAGVAEDVCTPGAPIGPEVCDLGLVDEDCDGKVNGADSSIVKTLCEKQLGVCEGSLHSANKCVAGVWTACTTTNYVANDPAYSAEPSIACDGLDNNCNGITDEACCQVAFTNLPGAGYLNNASCVVEGENCASVDLAVQGHVTGSGCPAIETFELWENGALVDEQAAVANAVTFTARAFTDGTAPSLVLHAQVGGADVVVSSASVVTVDLTDPVVAFTAVDVGGFTTPASGSSQTYTIADDQNGGVAGLQIPLHVSITDANAAGGFLDPITADTGSGPVDLAVGSPALPLVLGASPIEQTLTDVTMVEGTGTIAATAIDAAGNEAVTTFSVSGSDATPPAAVAVTLSNIDRHLPAVQLDWTAPGDDGMTGLAVAYEVRFSRSPITDATSFQAACLVDDITSMSPPLAPQAAGTAETFTIMGADVRPSPSTSNPDLCKFVMGTGAVTYYFAVRAVDDGGNWSPISATEVASTDEINVRAAKLTFSGTLNDGLGKMSRLFMPLGDINGDGYADFENYSNSIGKACVFLGQGGDTIPDLAYSTDSSTTHRCFSAGAGVYVGVNAAGLGDLDGDGIRDWAIGYGTSPERIDVFPGVASGSPMIASTPFLRITGQRYATTPSASQVYEVGDFDGDGLADIGVGSRLDNVFYVILGNAAWDDHALRTIALSPTADPTISEGTVRVVRIKLSGGSSDSYFGMNAVGVGNMLTDTGTQYDDVAIYQQNASNQVFVVKGRAVATSPLDITLTSAYPGTLPNDNASAVRIWYEVGVVEGTFGFEMSGGGVDLDGGGQPDLVIGHYRQAMYHADLPYSVYIISGEAVQARLGYNVRGVGLASPVPAAVGDGVLKGTYGSIIKGNYRRPAILGNFDGATGADLVMNNLSSSSWGSIYVRNNGIDAAQSFTEGTFPYTDLTVPSPYTGDSPTMFGSTVYPLGDFNGDGFPDIIVGSNSGSYPTILY
jgi:hypothetical protein